MTTNRYEDLGTGEVWEVGMRKGSYQVVSIQLQPDTSLRSIQFQKLTKNGKLNRKNKPKFIFHWDLKPEMKELI